MSNQLEPFKPTKNQRLAKARLWREINDNPMLDPAHLSDSEITRIAQTTQIGEWAKNPDFMLWFVNDKTVDIEIEAGTEKAVQRLIEIIEARDVGPREAITTTHQLAAIKTLLEYSSTKPQSGDDQKPLTAEDLPDDEKGLLKLIEDKIKGRTLTVAGGDDG
jgi:hypothetical protein